jgi:hypothetical protein
VNRSVELSVSKLFEPSREPGTRLETVLKEIVAVNERRRIDRTAGLELHEAAAKVDLVACARRGQCVGLMQGEKLVDSRMGKDSLQPGHAKFPGLYQASVIGNEPGNPLALGIR